MRIAVVAHVRHPVCPPFMGGMEAHAYHLVGALAARGHEVTLFAAGDSDAGVPLVPVLERHYDCDYPWQEFHGTDALNDYVDEAFAVTARQLLEGNFDVVHNNSLHRYPPRLARAQRVPMVTSLHVPAFDMLRRAVQEGIAPWSQFTATSHQHARSYWGERLPAAAHVVNNGIDLAQWPYSPKGDGTLVWAGRVEPNKAPHLAVQAAELAGLPLTLFGPCEMPEYFDERIRPHLSASIRYGGHLSGEELAREMGRAGAFVFTPMWDEPFGLVAIEAMACGLPVAGFANGGAREVVGPTVGRLVVPGDVSALARAMTAALDIPRRLPRQWVEQNFSVERMVDDYERIYQIARAGLQLDQPPVVFPSIELQVAA